MRALIGGHRPTALGAISTITVGLATLDLRDNVLTPSEFAILIPQLASAPSLTKLFLAGNKLDAASISSLCDQVAQAACGLAALICGS